MSGTPNVKQNHFRFQVDGNCVASGSGGQYWAAAENTNFYPGLDAPFKLRFAVENTGTANQANCILYYQKNGGGWVAVSTSSSNVRTTDASSNAANATIATTMFGCSAGAGLATSGITLESGVFTINQARYSEYGFGLQLVGSDLAAGDTIDLRCQVNTGAAFGGGYDNTPTITIPAADSAPSGPTTYQLSNDASDLSNGNSSVNNQLEATGAAGSWSGQSLTATGGSAAESIKDASFFTNAGTPDTAGNNNAGKYSTVSIDISSGNSNVRYSARLVRVNSSGVVQAWGPLAAESASGATAVYTFDCSWNGLGTWVSGDRLRLDIRARNAINTAGQSFTLTYASANSSIAFIETTAQALTPSLFTNSATFYTQTVSVGAVTLSPSLFSNTNTFYTQTVAQSTTLTPSLFSNAQTFYTQVVSVGAVTLSPSLYTDADTFYTQVVTTGAVDLAPSLFSNSQTYYTQAVAVGAVTLAPSLYADGDTFYTQTITVGAVDLAPSLFANSQTFYTQVVSQDSETQDLTPDLFSADATFYTHTLSVGAVDLAPSLFVDGDTFYTQTVSVGAVDLTPELFSNSNTFYTQIVTQEGGPQFLVPDLFSDDDTFYTQTITTGVVDLTPDLFVDADTFYTQVVTTGAVDLATDLFANSQTFYTQTVSVGAVDLAPDLFANDNAFYTHTVSQVAADDEARYPIGSTRKHRDGYSRPKLTDEFYEHLDRLRKARDAAERAEEAAKTKKPADVVRAARRAAKIIARQAEAAADNAEWAAIAEAARDLGKSSTKQAAVVLQLVEILVIRIGEAEERLGQGAQRLELELIESQRREQEILAAIIEEENAVIAILLSA
jgi:hypothetical protein